MGAGWDWGILLIAYFVVSTALSHWRAPDKAMRTQGLVEKAGARDAIQVAANGGVFALAAIGYWVSPGPTWQAAGLGALAASAADTWATEVGSLASGLPRSILSGNPVPVGTSGGVTAIGFAASLAGALFVTLCAWIARWPAPLLIAAAASGLVASVVDSVLGASLQARFWCASCDAETERRRHHCGTATSFRRGVPWMDNDAVNALATASGAALAVLSSRLME
jgi:uncharacterized protein (TIGR00297 family)